MENLNCLLWRQTYNNCDLINITYEYFNIYFLSGRTLCYYIYENKLLEVVLVEYVTKMHF